MKKDLKTNVFLGAALISFSVLLGSCEKNAFDPERVKATYENKFPVSDVDPLMDWKTTNTVSASISVFEDADINYIIRIYDTNPLEEESPAKLLAEGFANDKLAFTTKIDCPAYLQEVYVCRTDPANRNVVQVATIINDAINVTFGTSPTARALTRAFNTSITTYEPERSEAEIRALIPDAAVITLDDANNYQFFQSGKAYIIPQGTTYKGPISKHIDEDKPATIIIAGKWIPTTDIEKGYDLCVMNGGEIVVPDAQTLSIKNSSRLFIYKGGKLSGEKIDITNGSAGQFNYNAGIIELKYLNISTPGCTFYNCGTVNVGKLNIMNNGTKFVNQGKAEIEETYQQTSIENGCYLEINKFTGLSLVLGNNCYTKIDEFNPEWNTVVSLGAYTILKIEKGYFGGTQFKGSAKPSLVKIEKIESVKQLESSGSIYYEVKEQKGEPYKNFAKYLANSGNTLSKWGESPVTIPAGDCTGQGNTPGEGSTTPEELMPYTYVFEDNFPLVGDYDFNDIVLDVTIDHQRGSDNKITTTLLNIKLTAAGASKTVGAGLRIAGINASAINSITYEGADKDRFLSSLSGYLFDTGIESDGTIPLFGNAHKVFDVPSGTLVNTGGNTAPAYTCQIKIEMNDPYQFEEPIITKDNLDFFIAYQHRSMQQRMEVHLYEFWELGATKKGTIQKTNLDLAKNNTWAVCVPNFRYPRENINICDEKNLDNCAYPLFLGWVRDRNTNLDWYKHPNEKNVCR